MEITNKLPDPLSISRGDFKNITHINKFGRAPSGVQTALPSDIWDRADTVPTQVIWTAPTQARTHAIVSTSDADSDVGGCVAQGTGARTIRVIGLKSWTEKESSEDVIMDGTTAVNTANDYVIIYRMYVLTHGGNILSPNVGIITATAATDATVTAQINAQEGQTQMAIYGIPSVQTAYLTCYYVAMHEAASPATATSMDIDLLVNPYVTSQLVQFTTKHTLGVSNTGSSYLKHCFDPYYKIEGPAIIKLQALSSLADTDASAGFDVILIDN